MDLRSLGTAHLGSMSLDSARLGGNLMTRQRDSGPSLASFEEVLRNAASRNAPEQSAPAAAPELSRVPPSAMAHVDRSFVGVTIDRDSELFQQCLELETFLVKQLISSMRSTIQRSGLIEQGFAGQMYEDMLFDEYARHLTQNAGFGLAELAYLELTGQRGRVVLR
ncbi:MAG: rod-binding protein [Treponema sp.]|nr:rod-binding protein [Treponema sp.]